MPHQPEISTRHTSIPEPLQNNIRWHDASVTRALRQLQNGHRSATLWFTGLSGSGKSTVAHAVEEALFARHCRTFVFDGDNVRHGLCNGLGFSAADRRENVRRIGEMAKLFVQAGTIGLAAFISPYRDDRELARTVVGGDDFLEIYCRCALDICEQRDVKGLYRRARLGEIKEFTGVSAPYEEPEHPDLTLDTGTTPIEECVNKVIDALLAREIISESPLNHSKIRSVEGPFPHLVRQSGDGQ